MTKRKYPITKGTFSNMPYDFYYRDIEFTRFDEDRGSKYHYQVYIPINGKSIKASTRKELLMLIDNELDNETIENEDEHWYSVYFKKLASA